jgi:hypothetical protein
VAFLDQTNKVTEMNSAIREIEEGELEKVINAVEEQ